MAGPSISYSMFLYFMSYSAGIEIIDWLDLYCKKVQVRQTENTEMLCVGVAKQQSSSCIMIEDIFLWRFEFL